MPLPAPTSSTASPGRTTASIARLECSSANLVADHRPVHLELRVHRIRRVLDRRSHGLTEGASARYIHAWQLSQRASPRRCSPIWVMPLRAPAAHYLDDSDPKGGSPWDSGDGRGAGHSSPARRSRTTTIPRCRSSRRKQQYAEQTPAPARRRPGRRGATGAASGRSGRPDRAPRAAARLGSADRRGVRGGQGESPCGLSAARMRVAPGRIVTTGGGYDQ